MGFTKHEAIIVTGFNQAHVHLAHRFAKSLFNVNGTKAVSSVVQSHVNMYFSFFIGPDGSKNGWADNERGDDRRSTFREWCVDALNSETPMYLDVVEIRYGGDEPWAEILHTDGDMG
jgi:hypothetical protein